jgi:hypothetical protein
MLKNMALAALAGRFGRLIDLFTEGRGRRFEIASGPRPPIDETVTGDARSLAAQLDYRLFAQ